MWLKSVNIKHSNKRNSVSGQEVLIILRDMGGNVFVNFWEYFCLRLLVSHFTMFDSSESNVKSFIKLELEKHVPLQEFLGHRFRTFHTAAWHWEEFKERKKCLKNAINTLHFISDYKLSVFSKKSYHTVLPQHKTKPKFMPMPVPWRNIQSSLFFQLTVRGSPSL